MTTLELEFTTLSFHQNYVISEIKEDVIIDEDRLEELRNICNDHYKQKPFAYISVRRYSYNVNPVVYLKLKGSKYLKGIAVVSDRSHRLITANFEKQFSPVPFDIFQTLEDARAWAQEVMKT